MRTSIMDDFVEWCEDNDIAVEDRQKYRGCWSSASVARHDGRAWHFVTTELSDEEMERILFEVNDRVPEEERVVTTHTVAKVLKEVVRATKRHAPSTEIERHGLEMWARGAKYALREIAMRPVAFLTDSVMASTVKSVVEKCCAERDRLIEIVMH